jgi:urease accessory protein
MPIVLTERLDRHQPATITDRLLLTAEERQRSRHPFRTAGGVEVYLQLGRGTSLRQGDRLQSADGQAIVEVLAKPELVMSATANHSIQLLQAAYHLGNRHVSLEVTETHLYLLPDTVLRDLLVQRGLIVKDIERPFQPEAGAYEQHSHH